MASLGPTLTPYDIPTFTLSGVLPPFLGPSPAGVSALMSPYPTSLVKIVERFGRSPTRVKLLKGFLAHRNALADIVLDDRFQWLAGSFLEDVETLERRDPRDVDLITFFRRPALHCHDYAWENFVKQHLDLFLRERTRETYGCASIFVDLGGPSDYLVGQTRYWFGLFSHKRSGVWKGLQIPLGPSVDDEDAMQLLNGRKQ